MITYVLSRENSAKSKGYTNVRYPKHYSLPAIAHVSVFNPDTGQYERRTIRYCKGETSIFLKDQMKESTPTKDDITFKDGRLTINEQTNPNAAQFVSLLDSNGSKSGRDTSYPIKFLRYDVNEKFEQAMEREEQKANVLQTFMNLPLEKKRALSHAMGKRTVGKDPARWTYELLQAVSSSPASISAYFQHLKDPVLDKIDIISRAETMDVARFNEFQWTINGVKVLKVDRTQNPYMEFAQFLTDNPETWNNLRSKVSKTNQDLVAAQEEEDQVDLDEFEDVYNAPDVDGIDFKEEFMKAKENGTVKFVIGKGFKITSTGKMMGKSTEKAIMYLSKRPELLKSL